MDNIVYYSGIIVNKNMNRSFEEVIKSNINFSPSKQCHAFPKTARFTPTPLPTCSTNAYNLSLLDMTSHITQKHSNISKSPRFRQRHSYTPSPSAYKYSSFVDQARASKRGPKIHQHDRSIQLTRLSLSPGPGAYNPLKKDRAHYITMSPRYPDKRKGDQIISPCYYQTQKYDTIGAKKANICSKYSNISFYKIGKQQRFKFDNRDMPGPAAYKTTNEMATNKKVYSFGSQKRPDYKSKQQTPGPGAYQPFSEFSERKKRLQMNLNRMSSIVGRK